ncbi:MAG: pantoate--beta-alanine ligase [Proteobacteria bacterium]|nr:pantoate--beta-alanine ligase [Pseudomonadota bacterium]MBU4295178.1 pantoate--beta-alanine ligase [Pseudomonadota bacterium]MCG2749040.1 pantoate--beta-alanine ligase [Desulfobulbaceae bacterium]
MEIISSPGVMAAWADKVRLGGRTICLVPTMGFFHDGHHALMRRAGEIADEVVVSLFVNPMQFGVGEDLARYPRAFERDTELAAATGVAVLFAPTPEDVYPEGFRTTVSVSGLTETLCGLSRPGHFDGVTTVVAKLFHIVKPHLAVFGAKDFQQLAVIRKMVADLNWDVNIIAHPIVREKDGLAMSSRNTYLSAAEREKALCLSRSLQLARKRVAAGEKDAAGLRDEIQQYITSQGDVDVDYVAIVDAETLASCEAITDRSLLALAVKIGRTRLIDNTLLAGA